MMKEKVILAYSCGLDTTALIPWLKENFDYEVICCCIDCGQGAELSLIHISTHTKRAENCTQPVDTHRLVCLVTSVLKTPCTLISMPDTNAVKIPHMAFLPPV